MQLLKDILASTLLVAIIGAMMSLKNTKVNFITNQRTEWRKEIKRIILKIEKSQLNEISGALTELKFYLNYYGNIDVEDIQEEKMDFFKDEQIWKCIYKIEKCCDQNDSEDRFIRLKKELIDYIGFLLKFDWERSKREIKVDGSIIAIMALTAVGGCFLGENLHIEYPDVSIFFILREISGYIIPGFMLCFGVLLEKIVLTDEKKWIKEMQFFYCIIFSIVMFIISSYVKIDKISKVSYLIWNISYALSLGFSLKFIFDDKKELKDYEKYLIKYIKPDALTIYTGKESISIREIINEMQWRYFDGKGIYYQIREIDKNAISKKELEKVENKNNNKFKKMKNEIEEKKWTVEKWLENNRNKYIVVYRKNGKVDMTIGKDKKIWKEWLRN